MIPLLFSLLLLLIHTAAAHQKQLLEKLFADYRKELRPVVNERSGPTNVSVKLFFKQIQQVKEEDQTVTIYLWLELYWVDQYLIWEPNDYGGLNELHIPAEMIWKPGPPPIGPINAPFSANMNVRENEMQTNALVRSDGRVSLFRATITAISCNLDLHRFPFDQQVCFLMLASWSYDGSQIMLSVADGEEKKGEGNGNGNGTAGMGAGGGNGNVAAALTHYIPNMEWKLIDFKHRLSLKYYQCCSHPYVDLSYYFSIKRNPAYYLFTVTIVGFFTPHSSTGENTEKVSLGVTSLLSLALILMMVSDKLPATSDSVPLLGQYYIGLIVIQFVATYLTTLTLGIQMRGNAGRTIPRRLRNWLLGINRHNVLVKHLFGRELADTQKSIRQRMRKFDKLSAMRRESMMPVGGGGEARRKRAPERRSTDESREDDSSEDSLIRLTTPGAEVKSAPISVNTINCTTTPKMTRFKDPSPTNNNHSNAEQHRSSNDSAEVNFGGTLFEIMSSVKAMREDLTAEEHLRTIRNEWQQLARMIEAVLKLIVVTFTMVFAGYMLYDEQPPPLITDSIMNGSKT